MKANTKTIFNHLYEQMIKLDKKQITVEDAKAQANLAKQTNNLLNYELNLAIAKAKFEDFVITEIQENES
jgi:hypothetical protein